MSVSVAALFAPFGSIMPLGAAILAEFETLPVAPGTTVAVNAKVAVPPTARSTVVLMLPVPFAEPQLDPPEGVQVHVAFISVTGRLSATAAPTTALGPALLAMIVYVVCVPATSEVALFVLVIARSAETLIVSESVSLLLAGIGSGTEAGEDTVAVLTSEPVAELMTVARSLNVATLPGSRLTVVLMLPLPLGAAQLPPVVAVQVHVTPVSFNGTISVTVTPLAVLGPLLRTVMV